MKLFYRQSGSGQPLIILHGLFGSSDNWYSLAKVFAQHYSVWVVDQRNHGQSPHSGDFNYVLLTEDLKAFMEAHDLKDPIVIGHSMGGKVAMNLAVAAPERLKKLVVVDIVPKKYPVHHDHILDGLTAIPLDALTSRNEADKILSEHVAEPEVRQFLLKNLSRNSTGGFEWKINLPAIQEHIEEMGDAMQYPGTFDGPSLFVMGKKSNYFKQGDETLIKSFFPQAELTMLDTGHWVQAEKPTEFAQAVFQFLNKGEK